MSAKETAERLRAVPLFKDCSDRQLRHIASRGHETTFAAGKTITEQGKPGDHFYVILRGLCAVSNQGGLGPRRMLRPGDYFGEVALTMHVPRTASVTALVPTTLASCDKETFDEFVRPLFADDDLAPSGGSAQDA